MFHFYWPWFMLLLPLPFIIRRLTPPKGKSTNNDRFPELRFPAIDRLKHAFITSQTLEKRLDRPFFFLFSLSWIFLVIALMQPEKVDQFRQVKNKGYDLML